jgi:pimeloyl-ACP methyl ester carboxylesterase
MSVDNKTTTSTTTHLPLSAESGFVTISPELVLKTFRWRRSISSLQIVCLHGWVDNSASFELLAPFLVENLNADVIAIDLAGHGQSNHRLQGSSYFQLGYAYDICIAIDKLPWNNNDGNKIILIGHSMGGGICSVIAGSFSEKISKLILLDNLGLSSRLPEDACKGFRNAVTSQVNFLSTPHTTYSSIEDMVDQRLKTLTTHPGNQTLSRKAAERLVKHAAIEVSSSSSSSSSSSLSSTSSLSSSLSSSTVTDISPKIYKFTHDKRVVSPSLLFVDEFQAISFLKAIQCPTLILQAENGWPMDQDIRKERLAAIQIKTHILLPGSHHFHLDEETFLKVGNAVIDFLRV